METLISNYLRESSLNVILKFSVDRPEISNIEKGISTLEITIEKPKAATARH